MRMPHFICDGCCKESPINEGWWSIRIEEGHIPQLAIKPFEPADADTAGIAHACSRACAGRVIAFFMLTAKVDKSKKRPRYSSLALMSGLFGTPSWDSGKESSEDQ